MWFGASSHGNPRSSISRGSGNRAGTLGRQGYQPFANPFFDHASTYTPPNVKTLFAFCRHYFLTNGVINALISKAAEYSVTDLIIQHKIPGMQRRWEEFYLEALNYRSHQVEFNLDYQVFGNCFVSPSFPFRKKLECVSCNAEIDAVNDRRHWRYTNHQFWLACPKCGQSGFVKNVTDRPYPDYHQINIMRWSPEMIDVSRNPATGRVDYILHLDEGFRARITMGQKDLVSTTPQIFLEAVKTKRSLIFDPRKVFHMKKPSISGFDPAWGVPSLMPALKDAFHLQVMKKAQEAIMLVHLTPQVFLFPQPATASADPFVSVSLSNWRETIQSELARQRSDPGYYGVLPFPLGHQMIGENGRSWLLMPEIRQLVELIAVGMGFPIDLAFGQGTYAGTSVSMRMLENTFMNNVLAQHRLLRWLNEWFSSFLGWDKPVVKFKPFRMADDIQRQGMFFQLNQAGKISDTTLLSLIDVKSEDESEIQVSELDYRQEVEKKKRMMFAQIEGDAAVLTGKGQARAQQAANEALAAQSTGLDDPFRRAMRSPANGPAGITLDAAATALARAVSAMQPDQKQLYMAQLHDQLPEMHLMVQEQVENGAPQGAPGAPQPPGAGGSQFGGVDMRPQPEQLPPRRR